MLTMKINEQDITILSMLGSEEGETAYGIASGTSISVPQVTFRLGKLQEIGVVKSIERDNKTFYICHPALKSQKTIQKITSHIKAIIDEIDKVEAISTEGLKVILSFIVDKTDIEEPNIDDINKVAEFRKELEKYAEEHDLVISNIKSWTEPKIEWMALNDRLCACVRDGSRHCPCSQGLIEAQTKNVCTCSIFASKTWNDKMNKKTKGFR